MKIAFPKKILEPALTRTSVWLSKPCVFLRTALLVILMHTLQHGDTSEQMHVGRGKSMADREFTVTPQYSWSPPILLTYVEIMHYTAPDLAVKASRRTVGQLCGSDHQTISINIKIEAPVPSASPLSKWNFKKANWKCWNISPISSLQI